MKRLVMWPSLVLKLLFLLPILLALAFLTTAYKVSVGINDVWSKLGITEPEAQRRINNSFLDGRFQYTGAKLAGSIAAGNRVAVVNELVAYAKKYWNSPQLKTAYQNVRTRRLPPAPQVVQLTAPMVKAEEKQRLENMLKTAEEGLNSTNPKIKNGAPARIEHLKKQLSELDDPENKTIKRRLDDAARTQEYAVKKHNEDLQKFNALYPEDMNGLLKKRLQEILDYTADVDYGAELKEQYGKKVFVNPVYEKKPAEWKLAYRAGKEATDAIRAAAQQWLNELK